MHFIKHWHRQYDQDEVGNDVKPAKDGGILETIEAFGGTRMLSLVGGIPCSDERPAAKDQEESTDEGPAEDDYGKIWSQHYSLR